METLNVLSFLSNGLRGISNRFYNAAQHNLATFMQNKEDDKLVMPPDLNDGLISNDGGQNSDGKFDGKENYSVPVADNEEIKNDRKKDEEIVAKENKEISEFPEAGEQICIAAESEIAYEGDKLFLEVDGNNGDNMKMEVDRDSESSKSDHSLSSSNASDISDLDVNVDEKSNKDVEECKINGVADEEFLMPESQNCFVELQDIKNSSIVGVNMINSQSDDSNSNSYEMNEGTVNENGSNISNSSGEDEIRTDFPAALSVYASGDNERNKKGCDDVIDQFPIESHSVFKDKVDVGGIVGNESLTEIKPKSDVIDSITEKFKKRLQKLQDEAVKKTLSQLKAERSEDVIQVETNVISTEEKVEADVVMVNQSPEKSKSTCNDDIMKNVSVCNNDAVKCNEITDEECTSTCNDDVICTEITDKGYTSPCNEDVKNIEVTKEKSNNDIVKCIEITDFNNASESIEIEITDLSETSGVKNDPEMCLGVSQGNDLVTENADQVESSNTSPCLKQDDHDLNELKKDTSDSKEQIESMVVESLPDAELIELELKSELNDDLPESTSVKTSRNCVKEEIEEDSEFEVGGKRIKRMERVESGHKCDECGKVFRRKGKLENHMKVHLEEYNKLNHFVENPYSERPFLCEICLKCFKKQGFLDRHVRTKH